MRDLDGRYIIKMGVGYDLEKSTCLRLYDQTAQVGGAKEGLGCNGAGIAPKAQKGIEAASSKSSW